MANIKGVFQDIASAIREKDGNADKMKITDFAGRIRGISGGSTVDRSMDDVIFIGLDGEICQSYTKSQFLSLTDMPECTPGYKWIYTFEEARERVQDMGCLTICLGIAEPFDGIKFDIELLPSNLKFRYNSTVTASGGKVSIDWGDGTTQVMTITSASQPQSFNTHEYTEPGKYTIYIQPIDTDIVISGGQSTTNYNKIFTAAPPENVSWGQSYYMSYASGAYALVKTIRVGKNVTLGDSAFYLFSNAERILFPADTRISILPATSTTKAHFMNCEMLKFLAFRIADTTFGYNSICYCGHLKHVSLNNSNHLALGANTFRLCQSLNRLELYNVGFSTTASISESNIYKFTVGGASTFGGSKEPYQCYTLESVYLSDSCDCNIGSAGYSGYHNLKKVSFPGNMSTVISKDRFSNCTALEEIEVRDCGENNRAGASSLQDLNYICPRCRIRVPAALYLSFYDNMGPNTFNRLDASDILDFDGVFKAIWINGDGSVLKSSEITNENVKSELTAVNSLVPTKTDPDGKYAYTFISWIRGALQYIDGIPQYEYRPNFSSKELPPFHIIWYNYDGAVIGEEDVSEEGGTPVGVDTPTRYSSVPEVYEYVHKGWKWGTTTGLITNISILKINYSTYFTALYTKSVTASTFISEYDAYEFYDLGRSKYLAPNRVYTNSNSTSRKYCAWVMFIPEVTARYKLTITAGTSSKYIALFNANGSQLTTTSGSGSLYLTYSMTANTIYFYALSPYSISSASTSTFTFNISQAS